MEYDRVMGYDKPFPANQLGGPKNVWTIREYGLPQVWVKAETTAVRFVFWITNVLSMPVQIIEVLTG